MRTALLLLVASLAGCVAQHRVEVAPIAVQPIHMEIDVNVHEDGRPEQAPAARR
jgi:uncharacterized OsmC-like protein